MNSSQRYFNRVLVSLAMLILATSVSAEPKERVLYSFQGGNDGATPAGGVVFDKSGNLYGATSWGGTICPSPGCGVVFQVSPPINKGGAWTETVIYVFKGVQGGLGDGLTPVGGLIIDQQGNLYGTTSLGGNGPCILLGSPAGCGTVYELSPPAKKGGQWTEKILYNFQGGTDGYFPWGDLAFDVDGNLYGATQFGGGKGKNCNQFYGGNCGTVFKLSHPTKKNGTWKEKILHYFDGGTDGANPNGSLVFDSKGSIYGTTWAGGDERGECGIGGCGLVFRFVSPPQKDGVWTQSVLYRFHGHDGATPTAGIVFDKDGNLYGSVSAGATAANGAIFALTPPKGGDVPWVEDLLYRFKDRNDGTSPRGSLARDASGSLYGTALGGATHRGVVFRLKSPKFGGSWTHAVLENFDGSPDGDHPTNGLTLSSSGDLYGTTEWGGTGGCNNSGCGTVFELKP